MKAMDDGGMMQQCPADAPRDETSKLRVVIAICTCKRLAMLRSCLDSIVGQTVPDNWQLALVVVENDRLPHAQALVEEMAQTTHFPLVYRQEPRQGIPFARNGAIDEALRQHADWLLFIDDDEVADQQWLLNCAEALQRYRADVIHGKVVYQLPAGDRWMHLLERNAANALRAEGKPVRSAATNNVLIASRLFSPAGLNLRFDIAFQFTGGSDTEFFKRARRHGASIIYSALPVVYETVPPERCTVAKLFQREARTTAALVCIDVRHHGKAAAVRKHLRRAIANLWQCFGYLLLSGCYLVVKPGRARRQFLLSILRLGRCYGQLLGLSGRMLNPYKTIDSVG